MNFRVLSSFFILISLLKISSASQLIEVCPNPYGDDGAEYVKVFCDSECTISDGEGSIAVNRTGVVVIAKNSTIFYSTFGYSPDIEFSGRFALSNSGETVLLFENGSIVDSFSYGKKGFNYLDDGVIYYRENDSWDFRYQDWTALKSVEDEVVGRVIVSPADYTIDAEKELVLVSYTLTNFNIIGLAKKGVKVEVFLDAEPTGGIPLEEVEVVRELRRAGARVHFLESSSLKNFHYKFAIADGERVIITTENWKWSNRGYTIEFESKKTANLLKSVLTHDMRYESEMGKIGSVKGTKGLKSVGKDFRFSGRVEVFVLPDYNPVFDIISKSRERLYIQAPYMDFRWFNGTPILDSILQAARNGAEVKILFDSGYNSRENQKIADFLNEVGRKENLKIEAKLVESNRFDSLHAKMVVADNECIITSANFNRYGFKLNREVGLVIYSKEASDFLAEQFMDDWNGFSNESGFNYVIPAVLLLVISIVITYRAMKK